MDKPDKLGAKPLLEAPSSGHAEVAQFVCRARADIDNPVTDRATPLRIASQHGHADVAQFRCAATADINTLVFCSVIVQRFTCGIPEQICRIRTTPLQSKS